MHKKLKNCGHWYWTRTLRKWLVCNFNLVEGWKRIKKKNSLVKIQHRSSLLTAACSDCKFVSCHSCAAARPFLPGYLSENSRGCNRVLSADRGSSGTGYRYFDTEQGLSSTGLKHEPFTPIGPSIFKIAVKLPAAPTLTHQQQTADCLNRDCEIL